MSRNLPDRPVTVILSRRQARMVAKLCALNANSSLSLTEAKSWRAAERRVRSALDEARANGARR